MDLANSFRFDAYPHPQNGVVACTNRCTILCRTVRYKKSLTIIGWDALFAQGALKLVRFAVRVLASLVRPIGTVLQYGATFSIPVKVKVKSVTGAADVASVTRR